jgi:hypothetical protein
MFLPPGNVLFAALILLSSAVGTWLALLAPLALIWQTNWHQPRESEIGKLLARADFPDV